MAAAERTPATRLINELLERGEDFSFFQAMRLLESFVPDGVPVGGQGPPGREAVLLRPNASFGFPKADIDRVEPRPGAGVLPPFRMTVNFIGLYGSVSPLPAHFTEEIITADPEDVPRRDFLDLFHHRLIALFYRCWRKYRYHVEYRPGGEDAQSLRIHALAGLGPPEMRRGLEVDFERLLAYVGMLSMRGQSAAKIRAVLSDYLGGVPVRLEQFVERRVTVGAEFRNALGRTCSGLGTDLVLGGRVRDVAGKFRVILGPLSLARFQRHLPGGADHRALRDVMRLLLREPLAFDVVLELKDRDVPEWRLAHDGPCRLGWTTWLGRRAPGDAEVTLAGAATGDGERRTAPAAAG
jgi:type VI secretion system protein ImpH